MLMAIITPNGTCWTSRTLNEQWMMKKRPMRTSDVWKQDYKGTRELLLWSWAAAKPLGTFCGCAGIWGMRLFIKNNLLSSPMSDFLTWAGAFTLDRFTITAWRRTASVRRAEQAACITFTDLLRRQSRRDEMTWRHYRRPHVAATGRMTLQITEVHIDIKLSLRNTLLSCPEYQHISLYVWLWKNHCIQHTGSSTLRSNCSNH